jgi:hypothetical protein
VAFTTRLVGIRVVFVIVRLVCLPLRSDATLPPHPTCKLRVAGRTPPAGKSADAVPRIASDVEDAAKFGSCYYAKNDNLHHTGVNSRGLQSA